MPINPDAAGWTSEPRHTRWTSKDCLLYALGVGAGMADPVGAELEFTTENTAGVAQRALPTLPVVIPGGQGAYSVVGDVDHTMLVHGEQAVTLHRPLPVEGAVTATTTITGIYDKGSGAVIATRTDAVDDATGEPAYTTESAAFVRGAGGWGGDRGPAWPVELPSGPAGHVVVYETRPDQALLYRLSGDRNPLHSDRSFAAAGGFQRPILHGLCTYGFTGRALLQTLCGGDPDRFGTMAARFSRPVLPGETLTVEIWPDEDGSATFRTSTPAGVVVDKGRFTPRS